MDFRILKRRPSIRKQIDEFLDKVSEAGLLFKNGVNDYLNGNKEAFQNKIISIYDLEHKADSLRRSLEEEMYVQTLIPESRGDVLELLENMDALIDRFKGALYRFDIEKPEFCDEIHNDFNKLAEYVTESVESIVKSTRAFFRDLNVVADHMHKVSYWETESDKLSTHLQRTIFSNNNIDLSYKMQLRDFVRHIDKIADRAEDVADRLSIYVIKRSL